MITAKNKESAASLLEVLRNEANSLRELVRKRNVWLASKENQSRSTFPAVRADTMDMTYRLNELDAEVEALSKVVKN